MATVQPIHSTVSSPSGVCRGCGDPFTGRPNKKFCSVGCYNRFKYLERAPRRLIECRHCGKEFTGALRYCSKACAKQQRDEIAKRRFSGRCDGCGKDFSSSCRQRFCSLECANETTREEMPVLKKICKCGKKFKTKTPGKTWCSVNCWNRARMRRKWAYYRAVKRIRRFTGPEADHVCPTEIYARDGWVCQICSKAIDREKTFPHPKSASLDHIIPISKGGTHEVKNVQCAHLRCNIRKGNRGKEFQQRLF
jgi:hypothetical protein